MSRVIQKVCRKCGLRPSLFSGGGSRWCAECTAKTAQVRRSQLAMDVEKKCTKCGKFKSMRAYSSWCRECHAESTRSQRAANPEKAKVQARESALRSKYGMSLEDYEVLYTQQGGVCLCCGAPPAEGQPLHVDHDHACCPGQKTCGECVRGLLCTGCNLIVGKIEAGSFDKQFLYVTSQQRETIS